VTAAGGAARAAPPAAVTVQAAHEHQRIRGIGGISFPEWIGDLTPQQRETAFGTGEGQLGFSVLRIPVSPNREDWPLSVETARRARELGAIVFASPWHPPADMCETFRHEAPNGAGTPHAAETGTALAAAHVETGREAAEGGASVLLEGAGSSISWDDLVMGTTGPKRVTIRCAADQPGAGLRILADGAVVLEDLALPAPEAGVPWHDVPVDVPLEAGSNTLELIATGEGAVAVDGIRIAGIQVQDGAQRLAHDRYPDYARHLDDFVMFMAEQGAPLEAISIQNEPDYGADWTWWTPQELTTFLRENASAIRCRIIAPESFQYVKETSDPIIRDAGAWAEVDILGSHLYGTPTDQLPYPLFEQNRGDRELWMTEVYVPNSEPGSNERWPESLVVGESIHDAFVIGGFQAYVWWYIRRSYGPIAEDGSISRRGHVMSHFSRFLRAGSRRVELEATVLEGIRESAYRTAEGALVIVAINGTDAPVTRTYRIQGTSKQEVASWRTSASERFAALAPERPRGGRFTRELPARSITTFEVR
ncbi:carbohydrate-binding protein, partial [Brachybacterium hainanense]